MDCSDHSNELLLHPQSSIFYPRWMLPFRRDPAFLLALARTHGDVVQVGLGGRRVLLLSHPDAIQDVLVTQQRSFVKGSAHRRAQAQLGNGLLISEGAEHQRQRRLLQPAFQRRCLASYADVIVEQGAQCAARWHAGMQVDVAQEMLQLALRVVAQALCGADPGDDVDTLNNALTELAASFGARRWPGTVLLERLPRTAQRRRRHSFAALNQMVQQCIDNYESHGDQRSAVLALLLAHEHADVANARDQLLTLLLAGRETVAAALTWAWYALARHPAVEARLHAELDAVLCGRLPGAADLPRLLYTGMLFDEVLRCYPPAWLTIRRASETCVVAGTIIPANSVVLLSQYVVHHDARFYPEPFRFDPQRWTPEAAAARPRFAYFPFGGGPRQCIGEGFARMEGVLLLATLAQHWRLRLEPGQSAELAPDTSLQPRGGLPMTLERR